MKVKQSQVTLLVDGKPMVLADTHWKEGRRQVVTKRGVTFTMELVVEPTFDFEALWYDAIHHPTALDRWADDGGPS